MVSNGGNAAILASISSQLSAIKTQLEGLVGDRRDNEALVREILTSVQSLDRRIDDALRSCVVSQEQLRDEITHHSDSAVDMDTYGHDVLVLKGDHDKILKIVTEIYERKRFSRQITMTVIKWVFGTGGGFYLLAEILEQASARFP